MTTEIVELTDNELERRIVVLQDIVQLDDSTQAFKVLDRAVVYSYKLRQVAGILLCAALAAMKDRWEAGRVTLFDQGLYEFDFHTYARDRTEGEYANSTIDNMVDSGRTFLQGMPEDIPETIPLYDKEGQLTGEIVQTSPLHLTVSKMVFAKAAAKSGELAANPIALGQLFNPDVGAHTVLATLNPPTPRNNDNYRLRMYLEGPYIVVQRGNGEPEMVGELNVDGSALVKEAIAYIAAACQIRS